MLGWHISVYRQTSTRDSPAKFGEEHGQRLAVWQTGFSGLDWLEQLVRDKRAIGLGGNGYPVEFTAPAEAIRSVILGGPPKANTVWGYDDGDILMEGWMGKTTIDHDAFLSCDAEEWLLVQAWDES
jgi:hypothetical protein